MEAKLKLLCLTLITLALIPYSAQAGGVQIAMNNAPFTQSWIGVWAFSFAGGVSASFVRIIDIDKRLYAPTLAKIFVGTFSGVSLCALVASGAEPPAAALTFWAYLAALCSAPTGSGLLVFISDQNRLNSLFSRASNMAQDRYLPPPRYRTENREDKENNDDTPLY